MRSNNLQYCFEFLYAFEPLQFDSLGKRFSQRSYRPMIDVAFRSNVWGDIIFRFGCLVALQLTDNDPRFFPKKIHSNSGRPPEQMFPVRRNNHS